MGTNLNLAMFCKSVVNMDIVTWCKWKSFVLNFFDATCVPQNKFKLNAQHNTCLWTCLLGEIFVVV
jgi:hypothetical protein